MYHLRTIPDSLSETEKRGGGYVFVIFINNFFQIIHVAVSPTLLFFSQRRENKISQLCTCDHSFIPIFNCLRKENDYILSELLPDINYFCIARNYWSY